MRKSLSIIGGVFVGTMIYGLASALWTMVLTSLNNANAANTGLIPFMVLAILPVLYAVTPWVAGIWGGYKAHKFLMRKLEPKVTPPPTK
jgi:hypothetical protein